MERERQGPDDRRGRNGGPQARPGAVGVGTIIRPAGDAAFRVAIDPSPVPDPAAARRARRAAATLRAANIPGVREVHAGPRSVRVGFDPVAVNPADVRAAIAAVTRRDHGEPDPAPEAPPVRLVLCGCGACAPDRDWVAARLGSPWPDVLARFCAAPFDVIAVGFLPGFPYLGPLPAGFDLPRLDAPRVRVPAGSVGIGGAYAGIYPFASPGGWRLLGRIAERLFDPARVPPARFAAGDRIALTPSLDHGAVHD